MPHSTASGSTMRAPSLSRTKSFGDGNGDAHGEKFPDHTDGLHGGLKPSDRRGPIQFSEEPSPSRWLPRPEGSFGNGARANGHARQKSLSDAIRTIRTRQGSVSQNAHEIADALRAPVSPRLIVLCVLWYTTSVLTNTSSKSILNAFDMPATLTLVQFAFVASYCLFFSWLASMFPQLRVTISALRYPIRPPSREVIVTTLPLAAFQIGGHLLSSKATSKIPVSLVHTIKGLSPLFTVLAYRLIYDIRYPMATYYSLFPLTLGVMLACSGNHTFGGHSLGVFYALLATLIFVTQNIFSKRLFNEAAKAEAEGVGAKSRKLDKLNLLCYSSGMAFILTVPIWFWTEGIAITKDILHDGAVDLSSKPNAFDHGRLAVEFVFNGTFHFGQNMLAFVLLSIVSPVTYSVASLIKRVFIIVVALLWFRSPTTMVQGIGITLTFFGLYLYDRTSESNKADRRAQMMTTKPSMRGQPLLPLSSPNPSARHTSVLSPATSAPGPYVYTNGHAHLNGDDTKKTDNAAHAHGGAKGRDGPAGWLPPGTKQEDTWRRGDKEAGFA